MQAERRCEQCGQMIPWGEQKCPACGENGRFLWSMPRNALLLLSFLVLIILFLRYDFRGEGLSCKGTRRWPNSGTPRVSGNLPRAALKQPWRIFDLRWCTRGMTRILNYSWHTRSPPLAIPRSARVLAQLVGKGARQRYG